MGKDEGDWRKTALTVCRSRKSSEHLLNRESGRSVRRNARKAKTHFHLTHILQYPVVYNTNLHLLVLCVCVFCSYLMDFCNVLYAVHTCMSAYMYVNIHILHCVLHAYVTTHCMRCIEQYGTLKLSVLRCQYKAVVHSREYYKILEVNYSAM